MESTSLWVYHEWDHGSLQTNRYEFYSCAQISWVSSPAHQYNNTRTYIRSIAPPHRRSPFCGEGFRVVCGDGREWVLMRDFHHPHNIKTIICHFLFRLYTQNSSLPIVPPTEGMKNTKDPSVYKLGEGP